MLVERQRVVKRVIRVFVAVECGIGFGYLAYLCGSPLVPRFSLNHIRSDEPAFGAVAVFALVEARLGAGERRVLDKGKRVGVCVIGVLVVVERGIGFLYLADLFSGPLVPGLAAQHFRPYDPSFRVVAVLGLVEAGRRTGEGRVPGKCIDLRIPVAGVLVLVELGEGAYDLVYLDRCPFVPGLAFQHIGLGEPAF